MLSRRSIFGAPAALAVAALPAVAQADPWDAKIASLGALDARLANSAQRARDAGWEPEELVLIFCRHGEEPFLQFQRRFNEQFQSASFPKGPN